MTTTSRAVCDNRISMIWIIASIPFWIIAAGCLLIGALAPVIAFLRLEPFEKAQPVIIGSIILLLAAGIFALIAAKICS